MIWGLHEALQSVVCRVTSGVYARVVTNMVSEHMVFWNSFRVYVSQATSSRVLVIGVSQHIYEREDIER